MQIKKYLFLVISLLILHSTSAFAVVDDNASVVQLRKSCSEGGVALNNCFTQMGDVETWLRNTRIPDSNNPLLIEIGPGNFEGLIGCLAPQTYSHVTFRGAGMKRTIIGRITLGTGCTELSFLDLTVKQQPGSSYAVVIVNPGLHTRWTNVFLDGNWQEYGIGGGSGTHYWFASRTRGTYSVKRDKTWFFGSEITGKFVPTSGNTYEMNVLTAALGGEIHVYGSNLAAVENTGTLVSNLNHGVAYATSNAQIHIHGTGIDVISKAASDIYALWVDNGGSIHANETAYNMSTGTGGSINRIVNNGGTIRAPYVWEPQATPPNIVSVTGADTAVDTSGPDPVMIIYNSTCTGAEGPWYDPVAKACR